MTTQWLQELTDILEGKGVRQYGLDNVTQLEHALQAAWQAERAGCSPAMIAAALLHDVGHMVHDLGEDPAADGLDDHHEDVGYRWLTQWFGPEVTEPVRMHVAAKRYLCGTEEEYFATLSPDSVRSLALQGGPMSAGEAAAFIAAPYADDAVRLRRFDEGAKEIALQTPPVAHFMPYVAQILIRTCRTRGRATTASAPASR
jgi:phosphonate degradation associated HDIG domain protein